MVPTMTMLWRVLLPRWEVLVKRGLHWRSAARQLGKNGAYCSHVLPMDVWELREVLRSQEVPVRVVVLRLPMGRCTFLQSLQL